MWFRAPVFGYHWWWIEITLHLSVFNLTCGSCGGIRATARMQTRVKVAKIEQYISWNCICNSNWKWKISLPVTNRSTNRHNSSRPVSDFRSRGRKFHETKVPGSESSWNFCSWERMFQGVKGPGSESSWNFRSREWKFQGAKVPGNKWNFRSRERKFLRAKVP